MSAADCLDRALVPMRAVDCDACQLLAHGIHCQRTTRLGVPCNCPCRARLICHDSDIASGTDKGEVPASPGLRPAPVPDGVPAPAWTAAGRPGTPPEQTSAAGSDPAAPAQAR